jgi:four helix bundle protein
MQTNNNNQNNKYDLEDRTLEFSKQVLGLCRKLPKEVINNPLVNQLIRSSTSVGANYREANDSLGKKDFAHRVRIARKEAKESTYWLELVLEANPRFSEEINTLIKESLELRNILSSIIRKFEN